MAIEKLTQKKVDALRKPGRYGDGGKLYLQVGPTGSKSWAFVYMLRGRSRQMGLGAVDAVPLAEARKKAARLRSELLEARHEGAADPLEARRSRALAAGGATFRECFDRFVKSHSAGWKDGGKSAAQWRSSMEAYAYPVLGDVPVQAINTDHVYRVLEPIWASKSETAARVRGRIERVLDFAGALKLRTGENPARWRGNLEALFPRRTKVAKVEHHAAIAYGELPSFMTALGARRGTAASALTFAILTAARTGEVIGATWAEADLEGAVWIIPSDRMKGGREHRVPLSPVAVDLLQALPREKDNPFMFVGASRGRPLSNMAMLTLLKRMGREDLTVHGFRSTFRDWVAETTSYPSEVVEMALAHTIDSKVERAYRRGDLFDKRRQLMLDWAAFVRA